MPGSAAKAVLYRGDGPGSGSLPDPKPIRANRNSSCALRKAFQFAAALFEKILFDVACRGGDADGVVGTARQQASVDEAGIAIEVDEVAVVRCAARANECGHALIIGAGHAVEHLIDHAVEAAVPGVIGRNARRRRIGEREADGVVALIGEGGARVVPGADPVCPRKSPTDAFSRYGLAMECMSTGDAAAAILNFDLLLKHADYIPAYLMYGQLLVRESRTDEAKQILTIGIAAANRKGDQHAVSEMEALLADIS